MATPAANSAKYVRLELAERSQASLYCLLALFLTSATASLGLKQVWFESSDFYRCSEAVLLPGPLQTSEVCRLNGEIVCGQLSLKGKGKH